MSTSEVVIELSEGIPEPRGYAPSGPFGRVLPDLGRAPPRDTARRVQVLGYSFSPDELYPSMEAGLTPDTTVPKPAKTGRLRDFSAVDMSFLLGLTPRRLQQLVEAGVLTETATTPVRPAMWRSMSLTERSSVAMNWAELAR